MLILIPIDFTCSRKRKIPEFRKKSGINIVLLFKSGATRNRKSVCMALFLNKLYLYHDVNPLNKVFTALHRSTQVCILGTISECKDKYYYMKAIFCSS